MNIKVDGEQATVITTPSIAISFEKNQAQKIANKAIQLGDDGSVALPDWCAMQSGSCNPDASVMIQVNSSSMKYSISKICYFSNFFLHAKKFK